MSSDRMIEHQHPNTSDKRDENAPQVKPCNSVVADSAKHDSADNSSNDTEENIAQQSPTTLVDYPAGKIAADQADQNPSEHPRSFVHNNLVAGLRPHCCAQEQIS